MEKDTKRKIQRSILHRECSHHENHILYMESGILVSVCVQCYGECVCLNAMGNVCVQWSSAFASQWSGSMTGCKAWRYSWKGYMRLMLSLCETAPRLMRAVPLSHTAMTSNGPSRFRRNLGAVSAPTWTEEVQSAFDLFSLFRENCPSAPLLTS